MFKIFRIILIVTILFIIPACNTLKERNITQAHKNATLHKGKVFSLSYCITETLKHQTASEIYRLKKRIADENLTAKMLKKLQNQGKRFYFLNNNTASFNSGPISIAEIEQNINILSFSMAYLYAWQREDRSLISPKEKQAAEQKLKFVVTKIYFKAVLSQYVIEKTEKILLKCQKREKALTVLLKANKITALQLLDERKRFIRLEKQLIFYRRVNNKARHELCTMMGIIKAKKVNTECFEKIKIPKLPKIDTLEGLALFKHPESNSFTIATNDVRKTIVQLRTRITTGDNLKASSALYEYIWLNNSTKAAYASLRLPRQLEKYLNRISLAEKEFTRKLALAIGVTAQVRLAHIGVLRTKEAYELDNRVYKARKKHFETISEKFNSDNMPQIELENYELKLYECSIKRLASLCNYYIAYCRLLNVLGVNSLEPSVINKIKCSNKKRKAEPLSKKIRKIYLKAANELLLKHLDSTTTKFL